MRNWIETGLYYLDPRLDPPHTQISRFFFFGCLFEDIVISISCQNKCIRGEERSVAWRAGSLSLSGGSPTIPYTTQNLFPNKQTSKHTKSSSQKPTSYSSYSYNIDTLPFFCALGLVVCTIFFFSVVVMGGHTFFISPLWLLLFVLFVRAGDEKRQATQRM